MVMAAHSVLGVFANASVRHFRGAQAFAILDGKMPPMPPHVARKMPVLPAETVVLNLRHRRNGG
jgi:hypothetical protein